MGGVYRSVHQLLSTPAQGRSGPPQDQHRRVSRPRQALLCCFWMSCFWDGLLFAMLIPAAIAQQAQAQKASETPAALPSRGPVIGTLDFYGLRKVPEAKVRQA